MNKVGKRLGLTVKGSVRSKQEFEKGDHTNVDDESCQSEDAGKRMLRSTSIPKEDKAVTSDHKKKRIYAKKKETSNGNAEVALKISSKRNQNRVNGYLMTEKKNSASRTNRFSKHKETTKTAKVPKAKSRTKVNELDMVADVNNGLLKKSAKCKIDSIKHLDKSQKNLPGVSSQKATKKSIRDKKASNDNFEEPKPKKRKRVIRIDPYDISNKRLDDGMSINDGTGEKKKDSRENVELSKNAQFRAIQPSPSILSFVEDNLLGRRRLIELKRAGYNIELPAPLDNIPSSKSLEREQIEENIFRNKLTFFAAAKVSSSFPVPDVPEIAFAGRSNVGKSSLLNSLTRQWGVVRTSDKPGHTQSINFFSLGPKLRLVDLPGYGFAYAKEEVKDAWEELVKEYVSTRVNLRRVCLLIDTKWGVKPRDHELISLMERSQTKYQIVLTKTDTVFPIDVGRRAMQIEENLKNHKSAVQPVMMASSKSGAGIRTLRTVLAKVARFAKA